MAYHDQKAIDEFNENMQDAVKMKDEQFHENLNKTVVTVELNEEYSTNQKLKVYSALSDLNNCEAGDRAKYVKKAVKLL
jgi:type II secretory pathway component PulK